MKLFSIALMSLTTWSLVALSAPKLDREVQKFLQSSSMRSDQVLPVLIVYKMPAALPNRPAHPRHHRELEKLMMQNTKAQERALLQTAALHSLQQPVRTLWIANGSLMALNQDQLRAISQSVQLESIRFSQKQIHLIRPKQIAEFNLVNPYTYGLQKLNVPQLRTKYPGLEGQNILVGILDTGIDPNHPDLIGKLKSYKDFTSEHSPTASDGNGHGTHVAGTIAGGSTSGQAIGVAPQAQLVVGKIFDAGGSAKDEDILLAMQWMADPDGNPDTNDFPRLVSNSWGDDAPYNTKEPEDEPFCKIVENWSKLGMIPVFAAGNEGPTANTVGTPGACPFALTVGATDASDRAAYFSSRGPAIWKSVQYVKPNLAAPGVSITSAKPGGGYQSMSGTSMATPHIAGVMAVILSAKPDLTVDAAEKAILAGVLDLGTTGIDTTFGAGRADVLKSVDLLKTN